MRLRVLTTVCLAAVLAACQAASNPIFEWNEFRNVEGVAGAPADGDAAVAGSGATGQAGTAPDTGIPVEAGAGGVAAPDVRFEWASSLPRRGVCSSAVFVGTFTCTVQNTLPSRIDGTILLELVGPSETQLLDVGNGTATLLVDPSGQTAINTKVTGKVACMSRYFMGEIPETTFTPDQTGVLFQLFSGLLCASGSSAKARLVGRLDADALSLTGDVTLTIGTCICPGTFDLRAQ